MGLFDTPHNGVFNNPRFIYTVIDEESLFDLIVISEWFNINYQRWIICDREIIHLKLSPGVVLYSKEYNCIRGTFDNTQIMLKFEDFIQIIINDHRV